MAIQKVLKLYKNVGETPLECLERFRGKNPEYHDLPMTYAGRLDPMASGLLLVLVGEECKKKEDYLKLSKVYEGEILFGFSTDTGDILGLPTKNEKLKVKNGEGGSYSRILSNPRIAAKELVGKRVQKYPAFSSKTVEGPAYAGKKPLWQWAREGEEVKVPERSIEVYSFEVTRCRKESRTNILKYVSVSIKKVKGDFRQEEIIEKWKELLGQEGESFVCNFQTEVSSGTYIRSLAQDLGKKLDTNATLFSLTRTKVGSFIAD